MNIKMKRAALAATIVALLLSLCVSVGAVAYPVAYNGGERHVVCDELSYLSDSYYQGNQSYEVLSQQSGSELLTSLRALMTKTHTTKTSYNNSRDMAYMTDSQSGDGKIVLLYTSVLVTQSDFIGSGSIGWNREHVWPKSLGGFENTGAGADLHHVRPDDVTTNAKRGNLKFGNASGGSEVKGSSLVSGALGGYASGGYFEPLDNVKGDVARICLYVYVRYGAELSKCSSITNVFESVDVLLEWCESDPVDSWEMGRNEVVGKIQGNRNVFIDYPEYAWLIFGREVPEGMTTPSGMAMKKEETTAEATTDDITASVTVEETTEAMVETTEAITQTEESTYSTPVTLPPETIPAEDSGCGGFAEHTVLMLIPVLFAAFKKNKE